MPKQVKMCKTFFLFFSLLLSSKVINAISENFVDAFVSTDILEYEDCPGVDGPKINITNSEDYNSITVCWRFKTFAYPHCPGSTAAVFSAASWKELKWLDFALYQPISGLSVNGKQASWLGANFLETAEVPKGKSQYAVWHSVLFEPLKIYEWQNMCMSFNKKTREAFERNDNHLLLSILSYHRYIRISREKSAQSVEKWF